MERRHLFWLIWLFLALPLSPFFFLDNARSQAESAGLITIGPGQRYTEHIPLIELGDFGARPVQVAASEAPAHLWQQPDFRQGGGSDPQNPYAVIRQSGPPFARPGAVVGYAITLANYESLTHTFQLTDTLPAGLRYVPGSADDLTYDPKTRTLSWQGALAPGNLDYLIEESAVAIPYLDLADFGAVNLCDAFLANGEDCDEVTVTFNLGVNGYTANLYGQVLRRLTLSSNGLLLGEGPGGAGSAFASAYGHNQWLPDAAAPGFLLAGLWRDTNMGIVGVATDDGPGAARGRWHAAIVSGLIEGHDVFYAQWHDAPHADDPNLTARQAIAVVLDGSGPLNGHAFFIYDNISDPAQTAARGYTIGVEDGPGLRGATYAYAPCCGDPQRPQGYPPAAGTTLHLRPVLFGAEGAYQRTFSFEALVDGRVPGAIINTAYATSNSAGMEPAGVWATHTLYVRLQTYLPFLGAGEVAP